MQCYRYFDEGAGVTRLGAFEDAGANQWRIFELELMPITNELLDFRIRFVPLVSLNRAFAQVVDKAGLLLHPIYVVYQPWFEDSTIVFREGMSDIYRISQEWRMSYNGVNVLVPVPPNLFPYSCAYTRLVALGPVGWAAQLLDTPVERGLEERYSWYKFRHVLAEGFAGALRRNRGRARKITFSVPGTTPHMQQLVHYLDARQQTLSLRTGRNRCCYLLRQAAISSIAVPKRSKCC
jgi:hypothetical protein